jgi:hypothetical protein
LPFPTANDLQRMYEASLRRARDESGAAPTTVEALVVGFRAKGISHLQEPSCRRRLMDCSSDQLREIIQRLLYCRKTYPRRDPGITDELLVALRTILHNTEQAR